MRREEVERFRLWAKLKGFRYWVRQAEELVGQLLNRAGKPYIAFSTGKD